VTSTGYMLLTFKFYKKAIIIAVNGRFHLEGGRERAPKGCVRFLSLEGCGRLHGTRVKCSKIVVKGQCPGSFVKML